STPSQGFVVVWVSGSNAASGTEDGSGYGVFAQRFGSSGDALGGEFRVNTFTTDNQSCANAAASSSGDFVVVWRSDLQDGPRSAIFGQRFASSGAALGSE